MSEPVGKRRKTASAKQRAAGGGAGAASGNGESREDAICLDLDEDDPLEFLVKAGVGRAEAAEALRKHKNDPEAAQLAILRQRAAAAAGGAGAAAPAAGPAAAKAKMAADAAAQDAYDEMVYQRDLSRAQALSEAQAAEETKLEREAFLASARSAPLATFTESDFLTAARGEGCADAALLAGGPGAVAELLLLEAEAKKAYKGQPAPYFRRLGVAFAGLTVDDERLVFLRSKVAELADGRPGSMYGMPLNGGGGLPAVFSTSADGAVLVEPDIVIELSDED